MNLLRSSLAASLIAAAGLAVIPVSPAHAATTTDELGGSPVAGLCMISQQAVFAQSKVGQAAGERLNMLAQQAGAQLDTERKPLATDVQNFQQKSASLTEAQRKQQGEGLQQRMENFRTQTDQLKERIQLTRAKVTQRIGTDAQPIIASTYKSHRCGLLLNRDAVLGGNTTNDLTTDVVRALDAKITTITFNLEPLPPSNTTNNGAKK